MIEQQSELCWNSRTAQSCQTSSWTLLRQMAMNINSRPDFLSIMSSWRDRRGRPSHHWTQRESTPFLTTMRLDAILKSSHTFFPILGQRKKLLPYTQRVLRMLTEPFEQLGLHSKHLPGRSCLRPIVVDCWCVFRSWSKKEKSYLLASTHGTMVGTEQWTRFPI